MFSKLAKRKVTAVLSNSDTPETQALFKQWTVGLLQVPRAINSRATKRGPVSEMLVVNQKPHGSRA